MKEKCTEAHFIAYEDDIIIAAREKNYLKNAFITLEEDLMKINLAINRDLYINYNLSP